MKNPYKLSLEEIVGSLTESLVIDKMITYFEINELIEDVKHKTKAKIGKFSENDLRKFVGFKMKLVLNDRIRRNYENTENELFDLFMKSLDDDYYLDWDNEAGKFKIEAYIYEGTFTKLAKLPEKDLRELLIHNGKSECVNNEDTCKYCRVKAGNFSDYIIEDPCK